MAFLLSRYLQPEVNQYAPMDARAFARYGFLRKIGLFPVEQKTPRGAAQFLRAASYIFNDVSENSGAVLWITPQGEFTDARARPAEFRPGLAALVRKLPRVTVLPLAVEYTFWNERLPEVLALFGEPLVFVHGQLVGSEADSIPERAMERAMERAQERAQDQLAVLAEQRDTGLFASVLAGSSGITGLYELWQRLRAFARGERYEPEHGSLTRGEGRPHG